MSVLITGVAGFVGVNLARVLLNKGIRVCGVDNLSRGTMNNMVELFGNPLFEFQQVEITEPGALLSACAQFVKAGALTECWHLAANSDIPAGVSDAAVDLKDTFMTTFFTLEVMRQLSIPRLAFASSSAIYGDHGSTSLVEDLGPLLPISNYGAMKLASEAVISAAVESFLTQAWVFRFPNVIGVPATHGVILDFVRKLRKSPDYLHVLGDGTQQKGYLHVDELIDAMLWVHDHAREKRAVYNIGSDDSGVTVKFIAEETIRVVQPSAAIKYGHEDRGWVGDIPKFVISIDKIKRLGWTAKMNSMTSVIKAISEIYQQEVDNK
jgi:UDP-glucose 4-epimerase